MTPEEQAAYDAWLRSQHPEWFTQNTAEQAAAQNAAYRNNTLPVLPKYGNSTGYTQEERDDAYNEQMKHMRAFHAQELYGVSFTSLADTPLSVIASRYGTEFADQTQNYYRQHPTARYQEITEQYNAQHGIEENPYDPNTAAGIAWVVSRQGGTTTESLARRAYAEGFNDQIRVVSGIETVPIREYNSNITGTKTLAGLPGGTVDVYMPYGEFTQIRLENAKVLMDYNTGELGVYQEVRGQWRLVGGGGRNALQSGMFTINKPETPYVIDPYQVGTYARPSGEGMSRLGAEAYGGWVRPLDNRTLDANTPFSQYASMSNLANYVNPQGPNLGKAAAPGADIPWSIKGGPALQYMDKSGLTGEYVSPSMYTPSAEPGRLVGGKTIAGDFTTVPSNTTAPVVPTSPDLLGQFSSNFQTAMRTGLSFVPGFGAIAIGASAVTAMVRGDTTTMPFYETIKAPDIGTKYEALNRELAPYTTDITGVGKRLQAMPEAPKEWEYVGSAADIARGAYIGASQAPVDLAATFAGGAALEYGFGAARWGIAKAAMSEIPKVSTAGRMLSTPLAADIGALGKAGVGGYVIYEAGRNIVEQPTALTKGQALGRTAIQFAGFGAGMGSVKLTEPENLYAGRGYFSGKPQIGPLEKMRFKAETTIRSAFTEQPAAYREVATITLPGRVVEPARKMEPDFSVLSKSGDYAPEIRSTLIEQPHSVIGSSSTIQQFKPEIAAEAGLRTGKDVDVLIESPVKAITSFSQRTGLSEEAARGMIDVHPIPPRYPGFKPSVERETIIPDTSSITRVMGDPYRSIAFPRGTSEIIKPGTTGYRGELAYEAAQVQFGRKASGVSLFIEDPIKYGYRGEKDIYDFITLYKAERSVAISSGTPEGVFSKSDAAMRSFMERSFTYGIEKGQKTADRGTVTRSVREIYERMKLSRGSEDVAEITFRSPIPERGYLSEFSNVPVYSVLSNLPRSLIPYASQVSAPGSSVPSSVVSAPPSRLPSIISTPSAPSSPTSSPSRFTPSVPSSPPSFGSTLVPVPPSAPPSTPPSLSPPSVPPSYPAPPSTPPSGPPSSPPASPPTTVPPSTPPTSPPSGPPSSPPTYPPIYPVPPIEPPWEVPGGIPPGGGGSGYGRMPKWTKTFVNPVGADLVGASRGMSFRPNLKGMRFKKMRMPKF